MAPSACPCISTKVPRHLSWLRCPRRLGLGYAVPRRFIITRSINFRGVTEWCQIQTSALVLTENIVFPIISLLLDSILLQMHMQSHTHLSSANCLASRHPQHSLYFDKAPHYVSPVFFPFLTRPSNASQQELNIIALFLARRDLLGPIR